MDKKIAAVFFLWCISIKSFSQNAEIKNLVFEGAGIRGIAYAGVVEVLEKHDILGGIEKIGGTSAGAVTALMISIEIPKGSVNQ